MSQMEVYEVLKNRRLSGSDKYFSCPSICRMILEGKITGKFVGSIDVRNINRDLRRLKFIGILESTKVKGEMVFRVKSKVLEE